MTSDEQYCNEQREINKKLSERLKILERDRALDSDTMLAWQTKLCQMKSHSESLMHELNNHIAVIQGGGQEGDVPAAPVYLGPDEEQALKAHQNARSAAATKMKDIGEMKRKFRFESAMFRIDAGRVVGEIGTSTEDLAAELAEMFDDADTADTAESSNMDPWGARY